MPSVGEPYDTVETGTEFWHVYQEPYAPTSFNPHANGRFAARNANPARAMFYAGESAAGALWETVLRDVVPQAAPPHDVELPPLVGYRIARVRLLRDAQSLDLGRLGVRWIAGADLKLRDRITMLTTVPKYTATHQEAARLLGALPRADCLQWPSKQTGADIAYVFYEPPLSAADFEAVQTMALDSPAGERLIDQALAKAGMRRLTSRALAAALERELPPDEGS